MSVRLVILFALLLCSYVGSTQHVVEGVVQDLNGKPIPYATIGIPDKNVGTYSFESGFFSLKIPADYLQDSLMFSCIGFETVSRKMNELSITQPNIITLQESVSYLDEVTVTPASSGNATDYLGIKKEKLR